jgi:hypothetical protein
MDGGLWPISPGEPKLIRRCPLDQVMAFTADCGQWAAQMTHSAGPMHEDRVVAIRNCAIPREGAEGGQSFHSRHSEDSHVRGSESLLLVSNRQLPSRPDEVTGIPIGDALQIILVLRLSFPEGTCRRDLGHDSPRP